jgi:hypothetical protein
MLNIKKKLIYKKHKILPKGLISKKRIDVDKTLLNICLCRFLEDTIDNTKNKTHLNKLKANAAIIKPK